LTYGGCRSVGFGRAYLRPDLAIKLQVEGNKGTLDTYLQYRLQAIGRLKGISGWLLA